jgi:ferredoxin
MIKKLKVTKKNDDDILILNNDKVIRDIKFKMTGKNPISFVDGGITDGVCVRCDAKPCMIYSKEEIDIDIIEGMPYNNDRRVCPSIAISKNEQGGIDIDPNLCINCGVCVSKCQSGGIYYNNNNETFEVNHTYDESFKLINNRLNPLVKDSESQFSNCDVILEIDKITTGFANNYVNKFKSLNAGIVDLELVLVRNLLLEIGIGNKVSANGNNDLRLDFIGVDNGKMIPGESELIGSDILGLPRRILEGISWLHSRKKVDVTNQIPCVVVFIFPRKRSDFYEVISDIEIVTNVKIKTLSIYFLSIINLFRIKLNANDLDKYFTINKEHQDYGPYFKAFIKDIKSIDENYGTELYTFSK